MLGSIIVPSTAPLILPGDFALTPEWLTKELQSIFGAALIGFYIGEDLLVDGSGNPTSWPGRVGPLLTYLGTTAFTLGLLNGRKCLLGTVSSGTQQLGYADAFWLTKATLCVCSLGSSVISYQTLAGGYPSTQTAMIMRNAATADFFEASGRSPHYVNGIQTTVFPLTNNPSVVEGDFATNAVESGIGIGGNNAIGNRSGNDKIAAVVLLSALPTPVQRAKADIALKRYYQLVITADELKVASLPVDNPVVVAPLKTAFQSYGTVNSAFTVHGAPTLSATGTAFDGLDDALSLVTGNSAPFTFVTRARIYSAATQTSIANLFNNLTSSVTSHAIETFGGKICIATHGSGITVSGYTPGPLPESMALSVVGDGALVTYYVNGTLVSTIPQAPGSNTLILAGAGSWTPGGSGVSFFCPCDLTNPVLYFSALSTTNRNQVEAWAAAA